MAITKVTANMMESMQKGLFGNIMSPLVHIPFKRENDEVALSGTQTFTRASTGTYIDPLDGLVKIAVNDTPRFERMADGGTGILLEGASTNICLHSDDRTTSTLNSGLFAFGAGSNANAFVDTSGNMVADEIVVNAVASGNHFISLNSSSTAGTVYTLSLKVKRGVGANYHIGITGDGIGGAGEQPTFDIDNNLAYLGATQNKVLSASVVDAENGYKRIICTILSAGGTLGFTIVKTLSVHTGSAHVFNSNGLDSFIVCNAQLEALPFASSYIPTTTAAVTRSADNLSFAASGNVLDNLKDTTVICDVDTFASNNAINQVAWSVFGETYRMFMLTHTISGTYIHNGATSNAPFTSAMMANSVSRIASLNSSLRTTGYKDGVLGTPTPLTTTPTSGVASIVKLGEWIGTYPLFGHIRNFRIYDQALTSSEIAAA